MIWSLAFRWAPANWRTIAFIVIGTLLYVGYKSQMNSAFQKGYKASQAVYSAEVAKANAESQRLSDEAQKRSNEVARQHAQAIADLDAKYRNARIPAVRLCHPTTGSGAVPPVASSPGSFASAASPNGLPDRAEENPDIGPALTELMRMADEQTQRLLACQAFIRSLPAP